jgi:pectate lyase
MKTYVKFFDILFLFIMCLTGCKHPANSTSDTPSGNPQNTSPSEVIGNVFYDFDFSTLGTFDDGQTVAQSFSGENFFDTAVFCYANNTKSSLRFRGINKDNNILHNTINYNGENTTSTAGSVGSSISASANFYVGIDLSKLSPVSATVKVCFTIMTMGSTSAKSDNGIAYLVDSSGKALAVANNLLIKTGKDIRTLVAEVPKTEKIKLLYTRNGADAGGIDITSIQVIDDNAPPMEVILPESISLSKTTLSFDLNKEEYSETISATLLPANVTNSKKTIVWTSSDNNVASVSNGKITARKAGTAIITAKTVNDKTASCTVTVTGTIVQKTEIKPDDIPVGFGSIGYTPVTTVKGSVGTYANPVTTKAQLKTALSNGGLIYVKGMIDISEGMLPSTAYGTTSALDSFVNTNTNGGYTTYTAFIKAYTSGCSASTNDKSSSSPESALGTTLWTLNHAYQTVVNLYPNSNTTIIGVDDASGFKGGSIQISNKNNITLRNLHLQDAYDPFPHHEANDGFNAELDLICVQGTSQNIWIDHCTLEDTMNTKNTTADNGEHFQPYDGLCDMKASVKNITVSYCIFKNHDKTCLIGSSDSDGDNASRTITHHHNCYLSCGQRLPMVRNTRFHAFNNYYDSINGGFYTNSYCIGNRANALIIAEGNYFGSGVNYSAKDSYGTVYFADDNIDNSANGCNSTKASTKPFTVPYDYTVDSASQPNITLPANAGAGVWTVTQE